MNDYPYSVSFPSRLTRPTAITHVTMAPMHVEHLVPDQTVLIEDGVITAIGPTRDVQMAGADIIDGTGKYLMPGLADMHVHYWDPSEFGMFLANGVTTVRNMWGGPFHLALQQKVERGEFPGPHIFTTSPIIDGAGPGGEKIWRGSILLVDPSQARPLVQKFAERGYQQIKAYSWLTLEALGALGEAGAEVGLRTVGHCPFGLSYEEAIDAGMTCFEHLNGVAVGHLRDGLIMPSPRQGQINRNAQGIRLTAEALDFPAIRSLAQQLTEEQIWNCPTLVVGQQMNQDTSQAMASPLLRYESGATINGWNPSKDFRFRNLTMSREEWVDLAHARSQALLQVLSILHEEGAPLLVGTDTPNPFVIQGFSIHQELANFVKAGMRPYEALRCATSDPARFLGETERWGTIGVGKRADLLLLDANPLQNLSTLKQPQGVFVNGFFFSRSDLDALLREREEAVNAPVPPPAAVPPTLSGGNLVHQGQLSDRLNGAETQRVVFWHWALTDGSWMVEEHSSGMEHGPWRCRARFHLASDLAVLEGEYLTESFVGKERCSVIRSADGYEIRITDVDGDERVTRIREAKLVPDGTMAKTGLPLLLATRPPTHAVSALNVTHGNVWLASIAFASVAKPDRAGELCWNANIQLPGESTKQTYRLTPDGEFLGMSEMIGKGLRELSPEQAVVQSGL